MTPSNHLLGKSVACLGCWLAILFAGITAADAAPANDKFSNAQLITGSFGSVKGSNVGATQGANESGLFPGTMGDTIWYRWIAPASGRWSFESTGSDFDTFIAVFTASSTADLPTTIVATNDDIWPETSTSFVAFDAVSNRQYRIMIDGMTNRIDGGNGTVVLSWLPTPANDDFADAQVITGESGVLIGSNIGATVETNEPTSFVVTTNADVLTAASVWYRWTAPRSGLVAFDTAESNFDTVLAIYTGGSLDAAAPVAANDNNAPDGTSVVWFLASAGETYSISVNARIPSGVTDRFKLHWAYLPDVAPANDNFSQALTIRGAAGEATGLNYNATQEPGEPLHSSANTVGKSVWYNWTPASNGIVVFDTACSSFNTRLAMYTGDTVDALTLVTNNEISGLGPIIVPVSTGTVYHVAVDGYLNLQSYPPWLSPTGRVALHWLMIPPEPVNDDFSNAISISDSSGTVWGSNSGANKQTGEPAHAGNPGGASVWYQWVAPYSGRFTFDTAGSGFDTLLAIYTGSSVNNLTLVASDDDQQLPLRTSSTSFNAVSNTTYSIAVDGYSPELNSVKLGRFVLNWSPRYEPGEFPPGSDFPPAPVSPPVLTIQPDSTGLSQIISWTNASGFTLQMATNLNPGVNWIDLGNYVTNAGFTFYTNNMADTDSRFFRLKAP